MTDELPEKWEQALQSLAARARQEAVPPVDVRSRLRQSLRQTAPTTRWDVFPLAFAAAAMTTAAAVLAAYLPAYQALLEPWTSYVP